MRRSFTLIELLIVLVIIANLTLLALPSLQQIATEAAWAEIDSYVNVIAKAEMEWVAFQGTFAPQNEGEPRSVALGIPSPNSNPNRKFDYYLLGFFTSVPGGPVGAHYYAVKRGEVPAPGVGYIRFGIYKDGKPYRYFNEYKFQNQVQNPVLI